MRLLGSSGWWVRWHFAGLWVDAAGLLANYIVAPAHTFDAWMLTSVARCRKESMNRSCLFLFILPYVALDDCRWMLHYWVYRSIWLLIEGTWTEWLYHCCPSVPGQVSRESVCKCLVATRLPDWWRPCCRMLRLICILYFVAWVNLADFSYEWAKSFLCVMHVTVYSILYQHLNFASPPTSPFQQGSIPVTSTKHLFWVIPAAGHTLIPLRITYVYSAISPKDVRRLSASAIPYSAKFGHISASLLPLSVAFVHTPLQLGHLSGHVPQKTIRQERFKLWAEKDWPRRPRSEGYVVLATSWSHSSPQDQEVPYYFIQELCSVFRVALPTHSSFLIYVFE